MSNELLVPNSAPAEILEISPEALEVANAYLQIQDINQVADILEMTPSLVGVILRRPEVKAYINQVFFDLGFNNRFKMRKAMDAILAKKFQDLEESETGSSKDIADLLALSHKMSMELLDKEIALEKIRVDGKGSGVKSQTNIQINEGGNYGALLEKLIGINA